MKTIQSNQLIFFKSKKPNLASKFLVLFSICFISFDCEPAQSALTLDRALQVTDLIVVGTVKSKNSRSKPVTSTIYRGDTKSTKTRQKIVTEYEVEIDEVLYGNLGSKSIVITELGGSDGEVEIDYSFTYGLEVGKKIIALLYWADSMNSWRSIAFGQSILEIDGEKGEEKLRSLNQDFVISSKGSEEFLLDQKDRSLKHILHYLKDNFAVKEKEGN
jgi:hypothetical protein